MTLNLRQHLESLNGDALRGLLKKLRLNNLGAFCLGASKSYSLAAEEHLKLFRVLPNHEIVVTKANIDPGNRAMLELVSVPQSELVWLLDAERILSHVESGGSLTELRGFLEAHAVEKLPDNVQIFLSDLESKLGACRSARSAVLLDWQDEGTARLIASSAGVRKVCRHVGGNSLVVAEADYRTFARLVKKLGYVVPLRASL